MMARRATGRKAPPARPAEPPRWVCLNDADRKWLEDWTSVRVDEIIEPTEEEILQEQVLFSDPDFMEAARQEFFDQLFLSAFERPGRGRPKEGWQPLDDASDDVDRIHQVWRQHFFRKGQGRYNRTMAPTAVQIAAGRHGVTETALINFRKNRHRR
jgi:hypothetical protein